MPEEPTKAGEPTPADPKPVQPVVVGGSTRTMRGDVGERQRPYKWRTHVAIFLPNRAVSATTFRILILAEAAVALLIWWMSPYKILPKPDEVFTALGNLWKHEGLAQELWVSFRVNAEALAISTLISLGLAYLTVVPVFRPIVAAISKGRFLTLVGFSVIFAVMQQTGAQIKLELLILGMTVFYITSMAAVIAAIPKADFDHARTLRMKEWRVVWEVVVLGTTDKAFEVLRQNSAIGWMMLTMVEGISRSEGGVGVMLLNEQKHFRLAEVYAIQIAILTVGLCQDYFIGVLRRWCCPYADLTLERR
jgi:NitT/TauT family transport system permease protein